jgi:predicted outer membrane repeat protein
MRATIAIFLFLVVSLCLRGLPAEAQSLPTVPISVPIKGYYAVTINEQLVVVNTETGEAQVIPDSNDLFGPLRPAWDRQGERLVYDLFPDLIIDNPFVEGDETSFPIYVDDTLFEPRDWTPDNSGILGIAESGDLNHQALSVFDLSTGTYSALRDFTVHTSFHPDTNLVFTGIDNPRWNPVYTDWIALRVGAIRPADIDQSEVFGTGVGLLYNVQTGEMVLLNNFLNDEVTLGGMLWSPDGRRLLLQTGYSGDHIQIINFARFVQDRQFDLLASAPSATTEVIRDWLGISDMFLFVSVDLEAGTSRLKIGRLIDGELISTDFFSFPADFPGGGGIGGGTWHLNASEEERQTLSCLLDRSLPAQLQVGIQGRVTLSDGSGSRLHSEPGLTGEQVAVMSDGTPFMVVNGPFCMDGYRWWQLQLADNTAGWAAEADAQVYFLEPLPSTATPAFTPTATDTVTPTLTETYTVTLTPTPSVDCTATVAAGDASGLVNAINAANGNGSSTDTICLAAGSTYTFSTASSGIALPSVTTPITIVGNDAIIERGGSAPQFRLFSVASNGNLTLANVTLSGGNAGGENGGAVLNAGSLTLDDVTLTNNSARFGGAIYSTGTVTITGSAISGSTAQEQAGAIYSSGSLSITDSTFESNSARYGSGIYVDGGTVSVSSVVMRNNNATEEGGGIYRKKRIELLRNLI